MVLLLDVDFVVSAQPPPGLSAMLPIARAGGAIVLPAFEHNWHMYPSDSKAGDFIMKALTGGFP